MKLTSENRGKNNVVRSYSPTSVKVGDAVLESSCIVSAEQLISDWAPRTIDELKVSDFEPILALQPEIVLLGSGTRQRFPRAELMATMLTRGIGFEVMDTGAACRTYNVLLSEDRPVVLALLIEK